MRRQPLENNTGAVALPGTMVAQAVRRALTCGSVVALSSTLAMAPAWSQTAAPQRGHTDDSRRGPELEEVVVTATRRDTSILDVPYAISAISGKEIERQGVRETRPSWRSLRFRPTLAVSRYSRISRPLT